MEKQTPLIDLLENVPRDTVLVVEHDQFSSSSHPVGRLCHEAAAELRRLHAAHEWQYTMAGERLRRIEKLEAENAKLREALKEVGLF